METEAPTEQRAWSEYLAWTQGADPWQYVETEERAWHRLERALLHLRLRPWLAPPPSSLHRPGAGGRGGNSNEQQPLSLWHWQRQRPAANDQQPTAANQQPANQQPANQQPANQQPANQQPANQQPAKGEPGLARWEAGVPRAPPQSVALRTRTPAPAREASLRPQEGDSPTGVPVVSRSGSTMRCACLDPPRSSPQAVPAAPRSPHEPCPPPVRMVALSPESHGWWSSRERTRPES
jgi:hypothetical protein